ncbi:hypothetical protein [Methanolobus vulcani]|uniref:hypothetical protein n=1 Tax=Methanolobus vulcani TaxID=38026 RepID=UPI0012B69DBD|nr:hypothetical protein [Methanolobus vulcani]
MGKKNNLLWDLFLELYGFRITIYLVLAIFTGFQIAAWISGFFPLEYQSRAYLSIVSISAITIAILLHVIMETPSFIMSFVRGRYRR